MAQPQGDRTPKTLEERGYHIIDVHAHPFIKGGYPPAMKAMLASRKYTQPNWVGKSGKGNKPTGWSGTWSGTAHYNQSVFRKMLLEYKRTGFMPTFDIQVANEDPTASVGRQTIILKNCLTKGGILAKFDADAETLDEELEGTFDDWEMPETFSLLNGMQ